MAGRYWPRPIGVKGNGTTRAAGCGGVPRDAARRNPGRWCRVVRVGPEVDAGRLRPGPGTRCERGLYTPRVDIPPPPQPSPSPEDTPPPAPAPTQADGPSYADAVPTPAPPPFDSATTLAADTPPPAPGGQAGPPPVPPAPGAPTPPPYPQQPYGQAAGPYGQQMPGQPPYEQPAAGQPPYGQQIPGQYPYGAGGPYPSGGPYGPVPGPYGYPAPAGWYPVDQGTNGMAIASLVVSLAAGCVPFLGGIFGIVGLRQIRRNGQRGRGMAIAGIVINSIGTALMALFITLGVLGVFDEGNTKVQDLKVGQCFNTVDSSLSDYGNEGARSTTVDVVSCDEKHDAEAYAVFTLDPSLGEGYPGVDRISEVSDDKCAKYADDYLGDASLSDGLDIYYYLPPEEGWKQGDRAVTCFFGSLDGKVTGSVKSGGNQSGVGV